MIRTLALTAPGTPIDAYVPVEAVEAAAVGDQRPDHLAARGLPLLVRTGEAVEVLAALRREFAYMRLFSHEETGPGWSYERDKAVAKARARAIRDGG